jgi:hypothetical protein
MGFAVMKSGKGVPEAYFRHESEAKTFAEQFRYDVIEKVYSDDIFSNYSCPHPSTPHSWEERRQPCCTQNN